MSDPAGLVGSASKDRFFAAVGDNLFGIIVAAVVAGRVGNLGDTVPNVVFAVSYFPYFFLSGGLLGTTAGKFVCGLQVRKVSEEPCSWLQAGIRTVARLREVNPVLLGGLPAGILVLATRRRQRLGDLLAGTVVVSRSVATVGTVPAEHPAGG